MDNLFNDIDINVRNVIDNDTIQKLKEDILNEVKEYINTLYNNIELVIKEEYSIYNIYNFDNDLLICKIIFNNNNVDIDYIIFQNNDEHKIIYLIDNLITKYNVSVNNIIFNISEQKFDLHEIPKSLEIGGDEKTLFKKFINNELCKKFPQIYYSKNNDINKLIEVKDITIKNIQFKNEDYFIYWLTYMFDINQYESINFSLNNVCFGLTSSLMLFANFIDINSYIKYDFLFNMLYKKNDIICDLNRDTFYKYKNFLLNILDNNTDITIITNYIIVKLVNIIENNKFQADISQSMIYEHIDTFNTFKNQIVYSLNIINNKLGIENINFY